MHIKDQTPPYIPTPEIWSLSLSVYACVIVCLVMHTGESITFTHHWALKGPDVLWWGWEESVRRADESLSNEFPSFILLQTNSLKYTGVNLQSDRPNLINRDMIHMHNYTACSKTAHMLWHVYIDAYQRKREELEIITRTCQKNKRTPLNESNLKN